MKLFHYTTLETLALILKNRTLRLNCLRAVDDMDEAETSDSGSFKEHIFVSCWTDDEQENIGLWNMYSNKMKGIRIGIDSKKIVFNSFEKLMVPLYSLVENIQPKNKNSAFIIWCQNGDECFDNKIKIKYDLEEKQQFEIRETETATLYNFEDLACRKRKEWAFQKEIRYVLFGCSTKQLKGELNNQYVINCIVHKDAFDCDYVDLLLEDSFFSDIEVTLGPSATESEKIICEALLEKYIVNKNYTLNDSKLSIRTKEN
jgi:hypothetical protein